MPEEGLKNRSVLGFTLYKIHRDKILHESHLNCCNFTLCMLCFPNCKINIGLSVTRRRDDGYHDIETVFCPAGTDLIRGAKLNMQLHDVIEVVNAPVVSLHTSGLAVSGNDHDNLVIKAYYLMKSRFPDTISALDIFLHKTIPMGAGLGGGSADGAYMLRLLNDFFQLNLTKKELAELALQLGSDCPFFIYNTPMFATGRGEQMTDIPLDISAYSLQIICPEVHVSTAKAFSMIKPKPAGFDLRLLPALPISQWKNNIFNDFETPVFEMHPELAAIKENLYDEGALYASMSGSGSAIYGLFEKGRRAEHTGRTGHTNFYIK